MKDQILVYPIEYKSRRDIIKIKPLMDLHLGSKSCDLKAFKEFIKDRDENTYFYTNGDLWDAIYFSDKRFKAGIQDNPIDDAPIDEEIKEMVKMLSPIQDRIICIGHGNHEETIVKRNHTNMSKRLAEALNVPYLGYSFWFRLHIFHDTGRVRKVDFFSTHGFGGGTRTEGGSITKYSKFGDRFDADIIVCGHDHRKQFVRYPIMSIIGEKEVRLIAKPKMVCLGGSWKKAYLTDACTTWEETKGFTASEIGGITIEIKVRDNGVGLNVSM
jgi:UDP-2,3-diacylglucosamine pyrophosphatase LpxH